MRIAIDATTICDRAGNVRAGIEQYTWSLISAFSAMKTEHRFDVFVPASFPHARALDLQQGQSAMRVSRLPSRVPLWSRHVWLPFLLRMHRADVLFSPCGQLPLLWRGKSVVTVHDLFIFEHPDWFPDGAAQAFSTRVVVPSSLSRAHEIVAVSAATKHDLVRVFPTVTAHISVVPEAVTIPRQIDETALTKFYLPGEPVLYVGTVEPRKNLVNAIRAFEMFLKNKPDSAKTARFVIAGRLGWKTSAVEREIARVNAAFAREAPHGPIANVGPITEKEKWALLAHADVFFYPSFAEGFGLPVLEAMAAYSPVICSDIPSLRELAGDAALFVDPLDTEVMALAIAQCLLVPEGP